MMPDTDAERISRYLDGEDDAGISPPIDDDAGHRRLAETLAAQDRAVGDWFAARLTEPPPALVRGVRTGFAMRRARRQHEMRRWWLPAAAAAAVVVLGVTGFDYMIERRVGQAIDRMRAERASDLTLLTRAMQEVLETRESGAKVAYRNDATGFAVTLIPRRTWRSKTGHWCREFVEVFQGTRTEGAPVSTACRTHDGRWRRVHTELPQGLGPFIPDTPTDRRL